MSGAKEETSENTGTQGHLQTFYFSQSGEEAQPEVLCRAAPSNSHVQPGLRTTDLGESGFIPELYWREKESEVSQEVKRKRLLAR